MPGRGSRIKVSLGARLICRPTIVITFWLVAVFALSLKHGIGLLFGVFMCLVGSYILIGRFFHDAYLRRKINYRLTDDGLQVWMEGEIAPRCTIGLASLANVRPQFVKPSGHGTIELPPGGWSEQPKWLNWWDTMLPAAFTCRRLELIPNANQVTDLIRSLAATVAVKKL